MLRGIKRVIETNKKVDKTHQTRDENGRLEVNLTVRDDSGFISPFSYGAEPIISSEVAEFMDYSIQPKNYKEDLKVVIHSDVIDDNEKAQYDTAIRNYYRHVYSHGRQKIKRDALVSTIMLVCGVLFLGLMFLLDTLGIKNLWLEVIDIFAWVFLWEAADIMFFERSVSKWHQQKNICFLNAEIIFKTLSVITESEMAN